jgi:protoporphyrin/coproporphyrin ferrochelatase
MSAQSPLKPPADGFVSQYPDDYFDAILVLSFGGPEGMDDVIPFLENVTRGRNIPRERLAEVGEHYRMFDGVSPLNAQNRALIAALREELDAHGIDLPIYFGNRNWHPLLTDTLAQMTADGVKRVLAFFTSAYSSYSGCRQYRENLFEAQQAVGPDAPEVLKLRMFYNHPGFVEPNIAFVQEALAQIPAERRQQAHVVFAAHSIPTAMAKHSRYEAQLLETARLVAGGAGVTHYRLVYQSRSGPPHIPWLEPDVCDYLEELNEQGVQDVILSPIGFISDHMEVMFDLDVEAKETAESVGMNLIRVPTVGTHPQFISMIRELIEERLHDREKRALGAHGPSHDVCPINCCLLGNGRPSPWYRNQQ